MSLPILESLKPEALANTANEAISSVTETATNAYANVNNALAEFSSNTTMDASQSFLDSNSIIAKFVFLVLVLIIFLFLVQWGIVVIGYLLTPASSPYVVKGVMPGTTSIVVTHDPRNPNSVNIPRSNNATTGIEFTWSVWLEINPNTATNVPKYNHIFNKGNGQYKDTAQTDSGTATITNGPGLYVSTTAGEMHLLVRMDSTNQSDTLIDTSVNNIPIGKWFNVMIRLENKILDVYINGTIAKRKVYADVPAQNYDDIQICQNGGFAGALSDLRYFANALGVNAINNIVLAGPNMTNSAANLSGTSSNYSYYLSNLWYNSKITSQ